MWQKVAIPFSIGQVSSLILALFAPSRYPSQSQTLFNQGRFQHAEKRDFGTKKSIGYLSQSLFMQGRFHPIVSSPCKESETTFLSQSLFLQGRFHLHSGVSAFFYFVQICRNPFLCRAGFIIEQLEKEIEFELIIRQCRNPFFCRAGFIKATEGQDFYTLGCGSRNPFLCRAGFIQKPYGSTLRKSFPCRNPFFYRAGFIWMPNVRLLYCIGDVKSQSLFLQGRFHQV